jgi:hypothetical protein
MPNWMPEGNVSRPSDDEQRALAKQCQLLFNSVGPRPSPFPEGLAPFPGDNEARLIEKINILLT